MPPFISQPNSLAKGVGTIRGNVQKLMQPAKNKARKRAILSIARKNNITPAEAQFRQALAIARKQARAK